MYTSHSRQPSLKIILYQLSAILMILALVLSACKPQPGPWPATMPTTKEVIHTPTAVPTPTESGIPVVDNGAPLPPQLVDQQPRLGETLPLEGEVTLTFDQAMDTAKTAAAWQMTGPDGKAVKGEITWPASSILHFKPAKALASSSVYKISLGAGAISAKGVALEEPLSFEFTSVGELQVSQVFPHDGATDIANDAMITVIFNRPVVPLVIAEEQDKLPDPISIEPEIAGSGEWVNTSVYAWRPEKYWKGSTTYMVIVKAGLQDAGQDTSLAEDYVWQFTTTAPRIQWLELSNGEVNPNNYYNNLLLDEYFKIRFYQPMQPASTEAAFSLTNNAVEPGGKKVDVITAWNQDFTQVTITPTQRLALGAPYTLNLDAQAQAADGGALFEGLVWNFITVPPPDVLWTSPANNDSLKSFNGEFRIQFASPMNIESVKKNIVVTPQPEKDIEWWYNEWNWSIVGYFLKPSTRYEIRLLPGMQDIYGNSITQGRTIRFTNGPYRPYATLQMPYDTVLVRANGPQEFYTSYQNVKRVDFWLYQLSATQYANFLTGRSQAYNFKPPEKDLVWEESVRSEAKLDESYTQSFTPTSAGGEPLSPGFYFLAMDSPEVYHNGPYADFRLLVVADASLTFKSSTTDGLLWLTDLNSGKPVKGVSVKVYDKFFQPIGSGVTDKDGLAYMTLPPPGESYDSRFAMTDDGQVFAFASSQWGSGVSLYDYGMWGSYYSPANQPSAYVYTERPLYRPGQPVYFKGIVRLDDDLRYSLPDAATVKVRISTYEEMIYEEDLPLSSNGSFDGEIKLDAEAALGEYYIEVNLPGYNSPVGYLSFSVAEYRKPEFQVSVSADPTSVLAGEKFTAVVQADYYSGGGVANAEVVWTLTSTPFYFSPPDEFSGYSFADYEDDVYSYGGEGEGGSETIAEGKGLTDATGRFSITLPADLSKAKGSRALIFEATITDISENAVSGRATVVAHRSGVYPGVRPATYVGTAGKEQTFEIAALDWDGEPIAGQVVKVEIVERRWSSVQQQDASGRIEWTSSVEEILVSSSEVTTDEKGKASASFVPPNGGIFRAHVTALDKKENAGRASAYMWVAGKDYIPWRQTNDRSFNLVADRKSYAPGNTAEILIASPFEGQAYALITVERGRVHSQEVILLQSNSTIYKLPITADMAPNVYVSVLVVKGVDEKNPRPNFKMGITKLQVDLSQQTLTVELSADREQVGPGEKVTFSVRTLDAQGKPVSAEVSLSLSDLATLSLLPPNSAPILNYFYSERSLGVWTAMPISLSLEEYNATMVKPTIEEGMAAGSGGGGEKGFGALGVVDVRQDFPDTAFWQAAVQTNAEGKASVTVTLPDNLTTWRLDARAATPDTRVGQNTLDIVSTKTLLVRPQTPRFFVAGDQATLGAAVHNNSNASLSVTVKLIAEGLTLKGDASQTVEIAAKSQAYVTWEVQVIEDTERVDLIFSAEGGDYKDASRPPQGTLDNQGIPVYRYEAPETVATSGQLTSAGSQLEAITLPEAFKVSQGDLTVQISHSLAAGMTDSLEYLKHYPYECIEQTISRFLPNVITTRALKSAGLSDPALESDLKAQVNIALQRLYNWQNPDGGWGWWMNQESDPLTSAYVVLGLIEAQEAGYKISPTVLSDGLKYLESQVVSVVRLVKPELLNRQAFLLYVLARGGKPDVSSSVQLYDQRLNMALYARAFLAQTFHIADPEDARIQTLLSDLASAAILSATGSHWEEKSSDRFNWNTDTRTTAIVLSTLSQLDAQNPLNANAVRWLMSHRQNGHWWSTQETAWTLMGLTNWMVASGELEADYQYGVALNGERLGGGEANAETLRQTLTLRVDIKDLLTDEANRLVITRDEGKGNLYYTAYLKAYLPVEKIRALDQGIIVSRSYYRLDDLKTPVSEAKQGELLLARLTLVAPNALHYVIVDDPLPAGLEAVDQSLLTSPQSVEVPQVYTWEDMWYRGWGWWWFTHTQMRDEKVVLSARYLPAGTYVYTYLVRAFTVGIFKTIPPTAQEFYFPEVYGRGEGSLFTVAP